jgi:hypothetical protein
MLNKVEEALDNIRDVTLRAGVYSARQHLKQAMQLKDAIGKLSDQLATSEIYLSDVIAPFLFSVFPLLSRHSSLLVLGLSLVVTFVLLPSQSSCLASCSTSCLLST